MRVADFLMYDVSENRRHTDGNRIGAPAIASTPGFMLLFFGLGPTLQPLQQRFEATHRFKALEAATLGMTMASAGTAQRLKSRTGDISYWEAFRLRWRYLLVGREKASTLQRAQFQLQCDASHEACEGTNSVMEKTRRALPITKGRIGAACLRHPMQHTGRCDAKPTNGNVTKSLGDRFGRVCG